MKRWQKSFLGLLCLIYIIVLSMTIWPRIIMVTNDFIAKISDSSLINQHDFLNVAQISLLVLTVLALMIVVLIPAQRKGILLEKNKQGLLSLSN